MSVRKFNGSSDYLRFAQGAAGITGAVTIAILVRLEGDGTSRDLFNWHNSTGSGNGYDLFLDTSNKLHLYDGVSTDTASSFTCLASEGWLLLVVTKASGSAKPVFYKYRFSNTTLSTATGAANLANSGSVTGGTIRIGEYEGGFFTKGIYAAAAAFNAALTEAQVKALYGVATLGAWKTVEVAPKGLWFFSQGSVTEEVKDETGGGANQSARSGTSVVGEEPPIPYKSGGKALTLELTDSIALSESYPKKGSKALADSISTSETLSKKVGKFLSDSVSTSDALTKKVGKQLSESFAGTDSLSKRVGKALSDAISFGDELLTSITKQGTYRNRMRVVERPPMRQRILATAPNGRVYRWGEDSPIAEQIFEDLSHSDSANGGYKDLTVSLPRLPNVDYSDMQPGTKIELFGAGQRIQWLGRLERAPINTGDRLVIAPAAVGYEAALTDDSSAQEIYIASDLGEWGEASARRRAQEGTKTWQHSGQSQLLPAGTPEDPANPSSYSRVPAISHSWSELNVAGGADIDPLESWYSGGGVQLGRIELELVNVKGAGGSFWHNTPAACSDDIASAFEVLADFKATSGAGGYDMAAGRYYLLLASYFGGAEKGKGPWEQQWRNIRVYGRSGIPAYGTFPARGVLFSDVIANVLSRWAPEIQFTTGLYGTIKPTSFLIPHLVFKTPTTAADMIQQAARFELPEYGVWDGPGRQPTFYSNPRGEREGRKRWRVRVGDAQLEDTGQQMDRVWNGVVVQGTGTDGSTIFVGPPGSGMQVTSARCADLDPLNPINQISGKKRYARIEMRGVCTYEGMMEAAEAFLEQSKLLDGSGKATLTGFVEDEHGREWPYSEVKGGDLIEFLGASIPGYRYIVNSGKAKAGLAASIDIDAPADSYDALMERLGAEFIGVGLAS